MLDQSLVERVVNAASGFVRRGLFDRTYIQRAAMVTQDKGGGHIAHAIDDDAESQMRELLLGHGFEGTLFSEESKLVSFGASEDFLVSDPYCNTSLTFRGVRESAMTLYSFDASNAMTAGIIADMQIPRSACLRNDGSVVVVWSDGIEAPVCPSDCEDLGSALVVISLLKKRRRSFEYGSLIRDVGLLLTVDGGIVALRLAVGEVDAFVDAHTGQPYYEALAYRLAEAAGCVVTDASGSPIDWEFLCAALKRGEVGRQTVIAAATSSLHRQILSALGGR